MNYEIGGIILSKKTHACGETKWEIVRLGADVKLKCEGCKRVVFLSYDDVKKITKTYIAPGDNDGGR